MEFRRMDDPDFAAEFLRKLRELGGLVEPTPEELKEIYAAYKAQFTAADLAEYAKPIENPVFLDDLLEALKEQQKQARPRP